MRSLLGPVLRVRNDSPVPYVGRQTAGGLSGLFSGGGRNSTTAQLEAMGGVSTLFSIVNLTSTAVAKVDWKLYRKAASGLTEDRVEVTGHAALDLLNQPNRFMDRMELFEMGQQHIDLTGEGWLVIARNPRVRSLPLELWPVRPDRMRPDPHPTKFLVGYTYCGPDGEEVPLGLDEVIQLRMPNPLDPYRGLGPVQPLLTDLDSARYSAQWNRNFFLNSAEPGGIIQADRRLSDEEFDELRARWNEQHKGVANAHRVAIIEHGQWVNRAFSMREMEFTALRNLSRDVIMEAYRIHKSMLGISEDVNRANAREGKAMFAEDITEPRLERWKAALNTGLLPLYGDTAKGLEFDYESPVPSDSAQENADRQSRVEAAVALIREGADPAATLEAFDLPDLPWREKVTVSPAPALPSPAPGQEPNVDAQWQRVVAGLVRNADDPDLSATEQAWESAVDALLAQWTGVVADWIVSLVEQIRRILRGGDRTKLADLDLKTATATGVVQDAMVRLAETAARHAATEAAEQDVELTPEWPARDELHDDAALTVNLLAHGLETSAAREAQRLAGPDADPDEVAEGVQQHLESLSDAEPRKQLGGALHAAVNKGRFATFATGPVGALYATEVMDRNTCEPCAEIDGRWICNTDDLAPLYKLYPVAGYRDCEGGIRCRGTVTGVWRPQTTGGGR